MKNFAYYEPRSLAETFELLGRHQDSVVLMAGGTDLINQMEEGALTPQYLINLKTVDDPALTAIEFGPDGGLTLGSLVTIRQIETSGPINDKLPVLAQAAHLLGTIQVRNRATLGGNICNASPAADMLPALVALDAEAVIIGPEGTKNVRLEDFFIGDRKTVMAANEMLQAVKIPAWNPASGAAYFKHTIRRMLEPAIVGVAAAITIDPQTGQCVAARVALGAVAPKPIRVEKAEQVLTGAAIDDQTLAKAAEAAVQAANPIDDLRSSAEYRKTMVGVLVKDAVKRAAELSRQAK